MRVVVSPVLVDDRICRIVAAIESLLEVEEWVGEWWEPSGVPLTRVSTAESAPPELLRARGVPEVDIVMTDVRLQQLDVEALMRGTEPHRPPEMRFDEEHVTRAQPSKPRSYPGNARFRRAVTPINQGDRAPADRTNRSTEQDAGSATRPDARP